MQSIPEAAHTVEFDAALRTLAAQAATRYAGEQARIDRGLVLALNGGVAFQADGTALVQSQRDAEVQYRVNGHCDCPDASRAPEGRCKHRWAKCLTKRAIRLVQDQTHPLRHAYHLVDGVEGHARVLADGRAVFHPGGHKHSLVVPLADLCLGPVLTANGRPY
jgi:hypothetical protein